MTTSLTTPLATPLIVCDRVGHRYRSALGRETAALSDVSLTIGADEFVCLLGPSGCGKTTLLNLIAGFLAPTEGSLRVAGAAVTGPSPDRGIVFQEYSLFPWLTARGNVAFGPRMAGRPAGERRRMADACLALVGLEEAGDRYPFELSGGMKQRVAIARALATEPRLLLMDEPFAALDAMTRGALQAQLLAIRAREARTVLFVTHNIAEAIALGTRILVMSANPGRIVEDVPVDLPYPRRRTAPAFNALYDRLTQAIGLAVAD
ncbi:ABC transporter ATP-binding protein [Azospirillum doebereinerae]